MSPTHRRPLDPSITRRSMSRWHTPPKPSNSRQQRLMSTHPLCPPLTVTFTNPPSPPKQHPQPPHPTPHTRRPWPFQHNRSISRPRMVHDRGRGRVGGLVDDHFGHLLPAPPHVLVRFQTCPRCSLLQYSSSSSNRCRHHQSRPGSDPTASHAHQSIDRRH